MRPYIILFKLRRWWNDFKITAESKILGDRSPSLIGGDDSSWSN